MASTILYIIIGVLTVEFLVERILEYLNDKSWSEKVPESLQDLYTEEKYQKARQYAQETGKLSWISSSISFVVTISMFLLGGFAWVDGLVSGFTSNPYWQALGFFGVILLASDLLGTPLSLYGTFVIEEKYGFNKMSIKTFFIDKVKGWILGAIVGGLLLCAFIWFYESFRELFWLYAWGMFMIFTLLITMFYTNLIVPLFNKLVPLEKGALREAIEAYADSVKFPLKNIMVVDGSKRSTKANAYFSGLGSAKNIVLYDTLIEKHTNEELVAVLAHEVGHYKKKHTLQNIVLSSVIMLATLYVLHLFIDTPEFSYALGVGTPKLHLSLIAFSILYSPLSTITGLFMNKLSRKNEYEADAYATTTFSGKHLIEALKKLSVDHLSNLTPHPAYVFFNYSHPTLIQRSEAVDKIKKRE